MDTPEEIVGELVWMEEFTGIVNNYPGRKAVLFQSISMYAGNDRTFLVYVKDKDLNPISMSGASAVMTWKTDKSATSASLSKNGTLGATDNGEVYFYLVPSDTDSLDIRQYVFDIKVTLSNSKKYTVCDGVINLMEPVNS